MQLETRRYDANTIPSVEWINDPRRNPKRLTAVDLFAGSGSASLGLKLAGFDVRYSSEFIPSAAETYRANASRSTHLDTRDVREVHPSELLRMARVRRGELDLLNGSPPCKLFSVAATMRDKSVASDQPVSYSDGVSQRVDDLFDETVRLIDGVQPRAFMVENVPGLVRGVNTGYFLDYLRKLSAPGYQVKAALVDASRLGVPQRRTRLVFVGVRRDLSLSPVFPAPYDYTVSVRDVAPHLIKIHEGEYRWGDTRRPAPTITASSYHQGMQSLMSVNGRVVDDQGVNRRLSIPELKALFGLPADFTLTGTFGQRWERLGRCHAALAVYNVAATIAARVLNRRRE